jgi:uncharacterized RDD family membrane protein YckC
MEQASPISRIGCTLIDLVALIVISLIIMIPFGASSLMNPEVGRGFFVSLLSTAAFCAYVSTEYFKGWSLGKFVLGFHITAKDGSPATPEMLLKRVLLKSASTLIGFLAAILPFAIIWSGLSMIMALVIFIGYFAIFGQEPLALHDRLSGTGVFRTQK